MNGGKSRRLGHCRYAQILALMKVPATLPQLVEQAGVQLASMREIVWRMERLGLVHVARWEGAATRSSYLVPVFLIGEGPSVPYPRAKGRVPGAAPFHPRSELTAFVSMIRLLQDGATRGEVHEQTGVAYMRVSNLVRELKRLGLAHTGGWRCRDDGTGGPAEVVNFGQGKNVPRPRTISREQIQRKSREQRRAKQGMLAMIRLTAANMPTVREAA